jgi:hypothetical protein
MTAVTSRLSEEDVRELARLQRVIHERSAARIHERSAARREREQQEQAGDHDAA